MKEIIRTYFNRYTKLSEAELDAFCACLQKKVYPKKSYLLEKDAICRKRFFILEGLVRSFYIDDKGNEQTVLFGVENWWFTNMESFIEERPSELWIQAIEDTTTLSILKSDLDNLFLSIPKLERVFRKVTENMLIALQRRNYYYMKQSGEDKYNLVVDKLPDFLQRVPQYMIASYLGMTPEHLSALRKKK